MPAGEVGGGHQNKYKPDGIIHPDGDRGKPVIKFPKVTPTADRNHPSCWNSGTPVTYEVVKGQVTDLKVEETVVNGVKLLSSAKDNQTEYHPLIQFYNEVLARLINDKKFDLLNNLHVPDKAHQLWQYLETKYLK